MTENQLLELKRDIDEAKPRISELKGERVAILRQLKEEGKCDSAKQAEKRIQDIDHEIEDLDIAIQKGLEDLESKLNES